MKKVRKRLPTGHVTLGNIIEYLHDHTQAGGEVHHLRSHLVLMVTLCSRNSYVHFFSNSIMNPREENKLWGWDLNLALAAYVTRHFWLSVYLDEK